MTDTPYTIRPARYAKGKMAVTCPSTTGWKTRAACLAERLASHYTGRERAYILSRAAAARFEKLYAEGWDANPFTREFIPPKDTVS